LDTLGRRRLAAAAGFSGRDLKPADQAA